MFTCGTNTGPSARLPTHAEDPLPSTLAGIPLGAPIARWTASERP